jgi:DNA repair exonuclease SbcCD ATPase subunit
MTDETVALSHIILENNDDIEVKYVYHLSDIHIRNTASQYVEYCEIFEQTFVKMKSLIGDNKHISIIVVTGDIIHTKLQLSPYAVKLLYKFLNGLLELATVILIAGNHDCNLSNKDMMDSLTPIVDILSDKIRINKNTNNLYYPKKSGFYRYHNLVFGISSLLDGQLVKTKFLNKSFFKAINQKRKYKIALFHGSINGSSTESGYQLINEHINTSDFDGYDYVLLGDIHKYQFMNNEKTMAYAGSLIQQNHGESIDNHGVLRWNLFENKHRLYEISNDYGYCLVNIVNGVAIDTYVPPKSHIRFNLENTSHDQYKLVREFFHKKYKDCKLEPMRNLQIIVHSNSINDYLYENGIINNIKDDKMHIDKIKKYLTKKNTNKNVMESLIKLHKKMYTQHITEKNNNEIDISTTQSWQILEIKFSNMMSYGENNIITFEPYLPNKIIGILASNGSGKSSILDIILFCLFDKQTRGERRDIVNKNKCNIECSIKFKVGNKMFLIIRKGKLTKMSVKIDADFYSIYVDENNKEILETLNGTDKKDTQKKISAIIGTYEDYVRSCIRLQSSGDKYNFIDMTQTKRKEYLQDILKFNIFENLYAHSTNKITKLKAHRKLLDNLLKEEENNMPTIQNKIKDTKNTIKCLMHKKHNLGELYKLYGRQDKPVFTEFGDFSKYEIDFNRSHDEIEEDFNKLIDSVKKKLHKIPNKNHIIKKISDELKLSYDELEFLKDENEVFKSKLVKIPAECFNVDIKELTHKQKNIKETINTNTELLTKINIFEDDDVDKQCNIIRDEIKNLQESIQQCETNNKNVNKDVLQNTIENRILFAKHTKSIVHKLEGIIDEDMTDDVNKIIKNIIDDNNKWLNDNEDYIDNLKKKIDDKEIDVNTLCTKLKKKKKNLQNIMQLSDKNNLLNDMLSHVNNSIKQYNMYLTNEKNNKIIEEKINNNVAKQQELKIKIAECEQILADYNDNISDKNKLRDELGMLEKNYLLLIKWEILYGHYLNHENERKQLKMSINDIVEECREHEMKLKNLNKDLDKCLKLDKKHSDILNELTLFNEYRKLVGNTGLPYDMLKGSLPLISGEVNKVLSKITNFCVEFVGIDENDTKEKNQKLLYSVNINIHYPHKEPCKIELACGFERFIIDLAIRIALSRLSLVAKPNFLIIDEGWSCIDSENLSNIKDVMDYIKTLYDHVIIISHLDELKDGVDYAITIDKKDNNSHVDNRKSRPQRIKLDGTINYNRASTKKNKNNVQYVEV